MSLKRLFWGTHKEGIDTNSNKRLPSPICLGVNFYLCWKFLDLSKPTANSSLLSGGPRKPLETAYIDFANVAICPLLPCRTRKVLKRLPVRSAAQIPGLTDRSLLPGRLGSKRIRHPSESLYQHLNISRGFSHPHLSRHQKRDSI
jgi:hypothetical protein